MLSRYFLKIENKKEDNAKNGPQNEISALSSYTTILTFSFRLRLRLRFAMIPSTESSFHSI